MSGVEAKAATRMDGRKLFEAKPKRLRRLASPADRQGNQLGVINEMSWNGRRSGLLHSNGDWGLCLNGRRHIGPERTHVGGCEPGEPCNLRPEREWVKDLDKAAERFERGHGLQVD
jgi:hypothetical protein